MSRRATKAIPGHRTLQLTFGLTIFLSAFLLFQVQPIVSKALLPWFGGSPSVWTTCMLVFQWLLFAGYAYAHVTTQRLSARWQTWLQSAVLVAAVAALPILPASSWKSAAANYPQLAAAGILLTTVGLPFFLLSTTGPLLQAWYAQAFRGESPYRLYALSNAGSLLALLSYPFAVESTLSLPQQSLVWSACFVVYGALCTGTAWWSLKFRDSTSGVASDPESTNSAQSPAWSTLFLWFVLGMIPSAMMLATTNQVCTDVAPIPFLWLVPLALYLVSFILCFESSRWYSRRAFTIAFAIFAVLMTAALVRGADVPIVAQAAVFFGGFFCCAMLCHGELNRLKPAPAQLGKFYLWLAASGATGGALVSLLAPLLFPGYVEIHLAIVATLVLLLWLRSAELPQRRSTWGWWLLLATTCGTAAGLVFAIVAEQRDSIYVIRNFYGVTRVKQKDDLRLLYHGRILHGTQHRSAQSRRIPTTYYGERTGIGLALRFHQADRPRRIGVIGMGAGTLAAYGNSQDRLRFYELDPDVARVAREHFTYLSDTPADVTVALGDARLSLEAERDQERLQQFDVLAVDAFSGDAIPVHLLTREAVEIYLRHLSDDGILAFHVSNRYFDLQPVLSAHAQHAGLAARVVVAHDSSHGEPPSIWVLLAREERTWESPHFRSLAALDTDRQTDWTDDQYSLAAVLQPLDFTAMLRTGSEGQVARTGVEALERNDLEAAEQAFRAALQLNDRHAGTWLHLGNTLRRKGESREAIRCYRRAIDLDASYSEAHNNLGSLLSKIDPEQAEHHVREAIRLDPRNAEAFNTLGNLLARRGRLALAAEQFEQALAIKPSLAAARQNLQVIREQLKGSGD